MTNFCRLCDLPCDEKMPYRIMLNTNAKQKIFSHIDCENSLMFQAIEKELK